MKPIADLIREGHSLADATKKAGRKQRLTVDAWRQAIGQD